MTVGALLWADAADLVADLGYDEADAIEGVTNASWVLWALSGRRFHNEGRREETYRVTPGGRRDIYLRGPYTEIVSIVRTNQWSGEETAFEDDEWSLVGTRLYLRSGLGSSTVLKITYDVGSNLPPMTTRTTTALAEQYILAKCGDKKCKLPQRITSVTRDGVSWTTLDPLDFLEKGMTGLERVDDWLRVVNPTHQRQRARVMDAAQPRRVKGRWLETAASA